ncbi:N-acetylmuramoyl-L-alanine amidase [Actinotalea sp. Marseille-Q4924]|uniref:N-acetylmuramoyl-L-alanine amidase n=1 Tax=Actinotalea sp. Marseille-Q4924 TaxID=2866571 RepID=UPI001CE43F8B|nr:N-acetylmuramoyl-L-alanine amidase [Actinotalea sp. Marseille-Q4924]
MPGTSGARPLPRAALVPVLTASLSLAGCAVTPSPTTSTTSSSPTVGASTPAPSPSAPGGDRSDRPLEGVVVALDPGHNADNATSPETRELVDAGGGLEKPCNSTGAVAADGERESAHTWAVAVALADALAELGATTPMTRDADAGWGPCVDARGRFGAEQDADLTVSIHADGAGADGRDRGFHVIRPGALEGWTDDVVDDSADLAVALRDALVDAGFEPSTYRGVDGIDVRSDLGTLNWSDVPVVVVETHNMHHPVEGPAMRTREVQQRLADALADGVTAYVTARGD